MGTGDDARNAEVDAILAGGQAAFNRYMILSVMDIRANCARRCDSQDRTSFVQFGKFKAQDWGIIAVVLAVVILGSSGLATVLGRVIGG